MNSVFRGNKILFRNSFTKQKGVVAAELAILLPVLLFLLVATGEVARYMSHYNTLIKATRDSARYVSQNAALGASNTIDLSATLIGEAQNLLVYGATGGGASKILTSLSVGDVTVTSPDANHIQVSASYSYTPTIGNSIPGFGITDGIQFAFPVQSSIVMRAM